MISASTGSMKPNTATYSTQRAPGGFASAIEYPAITATTAEITTTDTVTIAVLSMYLEKSPDSQAKLNALSDGAWPKLRPPLLFAGDRAVLTSATSGYRVTTAAPIKMTRQIIRSARDSMAPPVDRVAHVAFRSISARMPKVRAKMIRDMAMPSALAVPTSPSWNASR